MENLDEFLKGSEEPAAEIETPEQTETPEAIEAEAPEAVAEPEAKADGPVRDEKGRFAPKGDKEPEASPAPEEPKLDHPALIGERRRRQALEAELEKVRAQTDLAQFNAQYGQPQPPQFQPQGQFGSPPDRWEDPEGYDRWLIHVASQAAEERATHAVQTQRIYSSAVSARSKYADYDDAYATFRDMATANPGLMQQVTNAPDPAEFMYQTAKTQMDVERYGGLEGLINARVQEALAKAQPQPAPTPTIPDTLADAQSARGSTSAQPFTVPSLDQILGR